MVRNQPILRLLLLSLVIFAICGACYTAPAALFGWMGQQVYSPAALETRDGNSFTLLPFQERIGPGLYHKGPVRYQQVFSAEDFSVLPREGAYLIAMFLRLDCKVRILAHGSYSSLSSNSITWISTTTKKPDQLSPRFAENHGLDKTILHGPGPLLLPNAAASNCSGGGSIFDGGILYVTPFFYNPTNGNLLLEILSDGIDHEHLDSLGVTDAENTFGDEVSRIFSLSITNEVADVVDTVGFPARFAFLPVPAIYSDVQTNTLILSWHTRVPSPIQLQLSSKLGNTPLWENYTGPVDNTYYAASVVTIPQSKLVGSVFFRLLWNDRPLNPQPGAAQPPPTGDSP